jgi:hypothetical protein
MASGAEEKVCAMSCKEMQSFAPISTKPATAEIAPMIVIGSIIVTQEAKEKSEDRARRHRKDFHK